MDVRIPCVCPGTPHADGDTVTLRERLDFVRARAVRLAVTYMAAGKLLPLPLMEAKFSEQFVLYGVEGWTLVDAQGNPIDPTLDAIEQFLQEHEAEADAIGTAGDGLYAQAVVAPLRLTVSLSSPPTPTNGSTSPETSASPSTNSSDTPPTPLRPSSTITTPTDATETTSAPPDGASSSSQNSASAA